MDIFHGLKCQSLVHFCTCLAWAGDTENKGRNVIAKTQHGHQIVVPILPPGAAVTPVIAVAAW